MTWINWLFPLVLVVGIWLVFRVFREKPSGPGERAGQRKPPDTSSQPPLILTPTKTRPIVLAPPPSAPARGASQKPRPVNVPLSDTPPVETLLVQGQSGARRAAPRTAPDDDLHDIKPPFPVKATLRIRYIDRDGQATERTVDVWEVGVGMDNNILVGRCRLRNGMRTFYLHRIRSCFDEETGEVVGDVYRYLREKYERSPEHAIDELLANEYDALRVLLYVGKADNVLRAAERAIIRETCRSLAGDSRIDDKMIDSLFKDIELLTERAFKLAVGRLAKRPAEIRATVRDAAERMVATDKKIHPAEQAALDYMRKRWE